MASETITWGLWVACADGVDPALDARDIATDAELLASRADEFEALIQHQASDLTECLRRAGTFVFHERRERGLIDPP